MLCGYARADRKHSWTFQFSPQSVTSSPIDPPVSQNFGAQIKFVYLWIQLRTFFPARLSLHFPNDNKKLFFVSTRANISKLFAVLIGFRYLFFPIIHRCFQIFLLFFFLGTIAIWKFYLVMILFLFCFVLFSRTQKKVWWENKSIKFESFYICWSTQSINVSKANKCFIFYSVVWTV